MSKFPKFEIGQGVSNEDIIEEFKCGNMGGMRRSHKTNTLVIISDHTKDLYDNKWIGDTLHYTGMGRKGDQDLYFCQNKTLHESDINGITLYLFEVSNPAEYVFRGEVYLSNEPYQEIQNDDDGNKRKVWMFPLKLK